MAVISTPHLSHFHTPMTIDLFFGFSIFVEKLRHFWVRMACFNLSCLPPLLKWVVDSKHEPSMPLLTDAGFPKQNILWMGSNVGKNKVVTHRSECGQDRPCGSLHAVEVLKLFNTEGWQGDDAARSIVGGIPEYFMPQRRLKKRTGNLKRTTAATPHNLEHAAAWVSSAVGSNHDTPTAIQVRQKTSHCVLWVVSSVDRWLQVDAAWSRLPFPFLQDDKSDEGVGLVQGWKLNIKH
ncbi:hypothetical protein GALMADRAFT_206032 [Galerina marginata CBS 339.88]|uniref:Uncharacterized protein n=1 Tax=Galerina marginata (strain CBS 339.88) TaxID=685588 RepID=A0A067TPY3_GALM3|nr:hypothetical protein GALMADRAFT_206032 [Galerina marginata CBS 339.88]